MTLKVEHQCDAMAIEATINPKLPTWSGDWLQWPDYKLSVELEADATSKDDLSRLAPKLVRNLTGKAWETAVGLEREKLKSEDGVNYLLSYLEENEAAKRLMSSEMLLESISKRAR